MSGAAVESVRTCTHPRVKRGVRDLFTAIAELIPEGQTTTPPLTLDELAAQAQHSGRTAQKCRDVLEEIGAIKVHDGGRGKVARYEILDLAGAKPLTAAPLPLLGRPKPPRTKEQRSGSDLFSDVEAIEQRSTSEVSSDVPTNVGTFFRRWSAKVGLFFRRGAPPWRRLVRARDVHTFKNVHTSAAPRDEPAREDPAPPRLAHPWHAWCGRVCVPTGLHQEFQRKGHDAVWLLAFYTRTCRAIPVGAKILVNDFTFWRTALKAELASATPTVTTPRRRPDILNRRPCPHEPACLDGAACVDRQMAEWQPKKEQSG